MASRKNRIYQSEKTREKIRTTQLKNRLEAYALGENDPSTSKPVMMEQGQVKAALGLLAKVMPDLSAADITTHEPESTMQEKFQALVNQIGEKQARAIYPDLASKYLGEPITVPTHAEPSVSQ
jgi:hypothetical protein